MPTLWFLSSMHRKLGRDYPSLPVGYVSRTDGIVAGLMSVGGLFTGFVSVIAAILMELSNRKITEKFSGFWGKPLFMINQSNDDNQ